MAYANSLIDSTFYITKDGEERIAIGVATPLKALTGSISGPGSGCNRVKLFALVFKVKFQPNLFIEPSVYLSDGTMHPRK